VRGCICVKHARGAIRAAKLFWPKAVFGHRVYGRAAEADLVVADWQIDTLVFLRNVGGAQARPNWIAALDLGLRVIAIDRPSRRRRSGPAWGRGGDDVAKHCHAKGLWHMSIGPIINSNGGDVAKVAALWQHSAQFCDPRSVSRWSPWGFRLRLATS